jgi:1-acyl-sn-glycerol-3-phosphate acyltransferase
MVRHVSFHAKTDTRTVRTALARLKRGHVVGMYPEGGLRDGAASVLGGALLRRGIGAIAQIAQVPVVPCVILGSDRLYRAAHWLPLRRVPVWVGFGESLAPPMEGAERDVFEQRLGEALRALPQQRMRGE